MNINEYINFINAEFPKGLILEIIDYQELKSEILNKNSNLIRLYVLMNIRGYTKSNHKNEKKAELLFNLKQIHNLNELSIISIREYFAPPLEKVIIQTLDCKNLNKGVSGLKVDIFIEDTIFSSTITDKQGKAYFFGIPSDRNFKVKIFNEKIKSAKVVTVFPQSESFNPSIPIMVPFILKDRASDQFISSKFDTELVLISNIDQLKETETTLIGFTESTKLISNPQVGFGLSLYLNYYFLNFKKVSLGLRSGWGVNQIRYSLEMDEIKQKYYYTNIEIKDIKERAEIWNFTIPTHLLIKCKIPGSRILSWNNAIGVNFNFPIKDNFNYTGQLITKNNDKSNNKAGMLSEQNIFFNNTGHHSLNYALINLIISEGITINTGIKGITLSPLVFFETNLNQIFSTHGKYYLISNKKEIRKLTEIYKKCILYQAGITLSINFIIPN